MNVPTHACFQGVSLLTESGEIVTNVAILPSLLNETIDEIEKTSEDVTGKQYVRFS